jgi:hypothetical protein
MRRFSISTLMASILVAAVSLATLRSDNELWAGVLSLVVVGALGVAMLGACFVRGRERAGWAGFAIFCGGYLDLAFGPGLSDTFMPQLGTTKLLRHVYDHMHPDPTGTEADLAPLQEKRSRMVAKLQKAGQLASNPTIVAKQSQALKNVEQRIATFKIATPPYDQFQRVGHNLFSLLAGLVGAAVAIWFHARRETSEEPGQNA